MLSFRSSEWLTLAFRLGLLAETRVRGSGRMRYLWGDKGDVGGARGQAVPPPAFVPVPPK